jgi:glyoxylase-like metal-dependent hydrolase (beta-lactamase superfamily II)
VGGEILATPGHSPGSVSLRLGADMLVGDLLRGGYLVGRVAGGLPLNPYYLDDADALRASVARVLDTPAATLHVGHGRAVAADSLRRRLLAGQVSLAPC